MSKIEKNNINLIGFKFQGYTYRKHLSNDINNLRCLIILKIYILL